MSRVHVVLWKWKPSEGIARAYDSTHVNHIARAIKRNARAVPVRVVCVTDDPSGITECDTHPLWDDCSRLRNASGAHLPSCYRRLKLYDRTTQREMGIGLADRILGLDLDTLVTGNLTEVLTKNGVYVGWKLAGTSHPEVYNGSFQMFTAGALRDVWEDFDPETSPKLANAEGWRGSDQSWLSMKLIGREDCTHIDYPILASYPLHCRRLGSFSARTRLVFFHGGMKPWNPAARATSSWIGRYWKDEADALPQ